MNYDPRRRSPNPLWNLQGSLATYDPTPKFDTKANRPNTVTVGGKTYIEHDNGRANVLLPYTYVTNPTGPDPWERGRSANRINAMLSSPFGAGAYGISVALGAPEGVRDASLAAGLALDASLAGIAPAMRRPTVKPPTPTPASLPLRQSGFAYGDLDAYGRPTGARGWVEKGSLGSGTKSDRRIAPPGWSGHGRIHNEARAHLAGRDLGGSGEDPRNIVTMTQTPTNAPGMSGVERGVAKAARNGEVINYSSVPLYANGGSAPSHVMITAHGSRGYSRSVIIANPAARRR
jgi:hypothetical protein